VNYTGCDSLFSAAAMPAPLISAATSAGPEPERLRAAVREAVANNGLEGLSPGTGLTLVTPRQSLYTRSRGQGADAMLVTGSGLWIGSDNGNFTTI